MIALDGRIHDIACGQVDIGNAGTAMTKRMTTGVPQANGTLAVEPVMEVSNVAKAVLFMADLPADANALFLTVMATKIPWSAAAEPPPDLSLSRPPFLQTS
jgi:hypothetical protein